MMGGLKEELSEMSHKFVFDKAAKLDKAEKLAQKFGLKSDSEKQGNYYYLAVDDGGNTNNFMKWLKAADSLHESIEELEEVNESFIVHKNGKPLVVKGKPVTAKSKDHAQKAINTMSKHPFNKGAKFSVHPHKPSSSYVAPRGSKPSNAKDDPHNTAMIRTKGDNRPAWRYAERGESVEEASLKRSYKDTNSYQLVFKDKNGKVQSTLNFDSKEKAEKQKKVRSKRLKPQDGSYEIYQVKG